jgi:hypothetical protein
LVVDTDAPLELDHGPFAVALPEIAECIQGMRTAATKLVVRETAKRGRN